MGRQAEGAGELDSGRPEDAAGELGLHAVEPSKFLIRRVMNQSGLHQGSRATLSDIRDLLWRRDVASWEQLEKPVQSCYLCIWCWA